MPKYIDLHVISYHQQLKTVSLLLYFRLRSTLKIIPGQLYLYVWTHFPMMHHCLKILNCRHAYPLFTKKGNHTLGSHYYQVQPLMPRELTCQVTSGGKRIQHVRIDPSCAQFLLVSLPSRRTTAIRSKLNRGMDLDI